MRVLESAIERAFIRLCEAQYKHVKLKLTTGWPDRMVLLNGGRVVFIEFKRPGGKPRKLQTYIHDGLRTMGFDVGVFDDAKAAFDYIVMVDRRPACLPDPDRHTSHMDGARPTSVEDMREPAPRRAAQSARRIIVKVKERPLDRAQRLMIEAQELMQQVTGYSGLVQWRVFDK